MEDRLKPCPFCGGEAGIRDLKIKIPYDGIAYFVECCKCDVRGGISYDGKQAAIEAWNTRKPMDRIVEELEEKRQNADKKWFEYCDRNEQLLAHMCVGKEIAYRRAIEIVKNGGKDE